MGRQHRPYKQFMAPGLEKVIKSQIWPFRAARIHLCQDSLQDIDVLQPIPCKMGREDRPKGKSRLSRSSSVSAPSIDPPVSTPRSLITSRSGALFGVIACVTIALSIPQLYPPLVLETQQSGSLGKYSNDTITTSTSTPQQRCNKTIEDAVEAAVMGGFLADAASLGLHGSVCTPSGLINDPCLVCGLIHTLTKTASDMRTAHSRQHCRCTVLLVQDVRWRQAGAAPGERQGCDDSSRVPQTAE